MNYIIRITILLKLLSFSIESYSQIIDFSDDFDDGDISADPSWNNNTSDFTVNNTDAQMGGSYYLSGVSSTTTKKNIYLQYGTSTNLNEKTLEWNLVFKDKVDGSHDTGSKLLNGENGWRVWLASTSSDPETARGYFITQNSSGQIILATADNGDNTYNNFINTGIDPGTSVYSIKVTRNQSALWEIFVDAGSSGATTSRGSGNHSNHLNSGSTSIYYIIEVSNTSENRYQFDGTSFGTSFTQYTWIGSNNAFFNNAGSWSPNRNTSTPYDILIFDGITRSIKVGADHSTGRIRLINNASISMDVQNVSAAELTFTDGMEIESGSTLSTNNVTITMSSNTSLTLGGSLDISNAATSIGNGSTIQLAGDFTLPNQSFALGSDIDLIIGDDSWVSGLAISMPNDFSNASSILLNSLVVNRTNGLTLGNQDLSISGSLEMVNGDINTNGNLIELASSATFTGEGTGGIITGDIQLSNYPIGTGSMDELGVTIGSGADDLGNITIIRSTGADAVVVDYLYEGIAAHWDITSTNPPISSRDISFKWFSDFDNGKSVSDNFLIYRNGGSGWVQVGGSNTLFNSSDLRQTASVSTTQFSSWTVTNITNPLPVELIEFKGETIDQGIELHWSTASEINNDYFEVFHMNTLGDWTLLGKIPGNGTTNELSNYKYLDQEPYPSTNQYKLVQYDFDGVSTVEGIIVVDYELQNIIKVFPIPVKDKIFIYNGINSEVNLEIHDLKGTVVSRFNIKQGVNEKNIEGIPPGIYIFVSKSGDKILSNNKVVISK